MTLWLLLLGCTPDDTISPWRIDAQDLGEPLASGSGYDTETPAAAWFAAEQVLPDLAREAPASTLPLQLWEEIYDDESIADSGSCPYLVAEGATLSWVSNCRSQEGYEWSGSVSLTEWEEDGREWDLWELDIEVLGREESSAFERVFAHGSVLQVTGGGDDLLQATQVNYRAGAEGFSRLGVTDDQQELAWEDLHHSGRVEEHRDGLTVVEGSVSLGTLGGFSYESLGGMSWTAGCGSEPIGTLSLGPSTILDFDGKGSCDHCAEMSVGGDEVEAACGS